jgi:hypothetical protein
VGGIRSAGLLRGFTLDRVTVLADREGRPFLEADGVRVGYSVRGFLARDVVLEPVDLIRPRVTIETLPGDTASQRGPDLRVAEPDRKSHGRCRPTSAWSSAGARIRGGLRSWRAEDAETRLGGSRPASGSAVLLDPGRPGSPSTSSPSPWSGSARCWARGRSGWRSSEGLLRREGHPARGGGPGAPPPEPMPVGGSTLDWGGAWSSSWTWTCRSLRCPGPGLARSPDPRGPGALPPPGRGTSGRRPLASTGPSSPGADGSPGAWAFELGETLRLLDTRVEGSSLDLLDPWLDEPLPVEGRLRGACQLDGPPDRPRGGRRCDLRRSRPGDPGVPARITGKGEPRGRTVSGLSVRVDPLRLETLQALEPRPSRGKGPWSSRPPGGSIGGLELSALRWSMPPPRVDLSRVLAQGTVRRDGETLRACPRHFVRPPFPGGARAGGSHRASRGRRLLRGAGSDGPLEALAPGVT